MFRNSVAGIMVFVFLLLFMMVHPSWAEVRSGDAISHGSQGSPAPRPSSVEPHETDEIGSKLPLWSVIPFAGILLSIALLPLLAPQFWHHHFPKVSAFWSLVLAIPFVYAFKGVGVERILHIYLIDYIPFIILLWALFTISGGILVGGSLQGRPIENTVLLFIGTILASWVGTTGASMIMIRPVLRANALRKRKTHIFCFFIFLIANIGGSLTPLGDPPLFLGFLHGVPFFWTFHILPHMLFCTIILLITFFLFDSVYYRKEDQRKDLLNKKAKESTRVSGWHNFFCLAGVVGAILMSGILRLGEISVFHVPISKQNLLRDFLIIAMGALSLKTTKKSIREANAFSWAPILEVAYLFAGIFMTIIPALAILKAGSEGALAFLLDRISEPYHYFWMSGALSSFLDNAPTYLTFFNCALGKLGLPEEMLIQALGYVTGVEGDPIFVSYLIGVSAGSVFMGANTYIGNAPNFMVKSIAEEAGIAMPSFFGYMFKFSLPILIPLFLLVTFVFF